MNVRSRLSMLLAMRTSALGGENVIGGILEAYLLIFGDEMVVLDTKWRSLGDST